MEIPCGTIMIMDICEHIWKIMEIRYNIYIISSYSDSGKLMITSGHTHNVYTYIYIHN